MNIVLFGVLLVLAASLGGGIARAGDVREQQSAAVWRKENQCARDGFAKFPDYTAESNAAREKLIRDCEIKNRVPVRTPASESPVRTIPDDEAN